MQKRFQVEKNWVPRWGADLGLGEDRYGVMRKEGQARSSNPAKPCFFV